jgi:hypothetical protein
MNRVQSSALVSLVVGICHVVAGCGDDGAGSGGSGSDGSATTTKSSSQAGGDGGGGGTQVDACEPTDGEVVPVTCGIFVNGDAAENGDGSQAAPYDNLTDAVAQAAGSNNRIYVCGTLTEAVTVGPGVEIHGELDCANGWRWDFQTRTVWESLVGSTPLHTIGGPSPTVITGFQIESRDAVDPGASSIAVIVEGGTLSMTRSTVIAGDASAGAFGMGVPGIPGVDGGDGGTLSFGGTGGVGAASPCGGADGGMGGWCVPDFPNPCIYEEPTPPSTAGTNGTTTCTPGDDGTPGAPGAPGADAVGIGSISEGGYTPSDGQPGTAGTVGGAGGGGGAKMQPDYYGGGGGSGGCGAEGSTAGRGGGSSIAFLSLNATLQFSDVISRVGRGGNGGAGGASAPGGAGGVGGEGGCTLPTGCGTAGGCSGGNGGVGGAGGAGGSGAGGHAIIIAYTGIQSSIDGLSPEIPIDQGGLSGGGIASAGVSEVQFEFP